MTFHKAKEESKWKQWKEQEERILRKSGVSEEVIQRLRELDWQDFNAERRFWEHFLLVKKNYTPGNWKNHLQWCLIFNSYLTVWRMSSYYRFFWSRIRKHCRFYF